MTSVSMTKRLEFDAGHRLLYHESKCSNPHGHRYAVEVTLLLEPGASLDHAGRIVDFGAVKDRLGAWIDKHLDHGFILHDADPLAVYLMVHDDKVHLVPFHPSAENLAAYLLRVARKLLDDVSRCRVTSVVLWETPTSRAEAR